MVIGMRVFYIFNIKEEFKYLYKDHFFDLFHMLKKIYSLKEEDLLYGKTLFHQLTSSFNKIDLDNLLFIKLHQDMPYSKRGNIHYMNNLYKNEVSRLEIKTAYIRLELESNTSSFLEILGQLNKNLFACDFEHFEYFFIEQSKNLV